MEQKEKTKNPLTSKRIIIGIGVAATLLSGPKIIDNINGPETHGSVLYTVQPGDALSSIAQSIPGSENTNYNAVAYEIQQINGLPNSNIQIADKLFIPTSVEQ
jgi:LysM repeat protein